MVAWKRWILWGLLLGTALLALSVMSGSVSLHSLRRHRIEGFEIGDLSTSANLQQMSTQAIDAAPSTSEVKTHYKNLLLFADADIRASGTAGLRIVADLRDRLFGPRSFKQSLDVEDFKGNWPNWLPPLDTTAKETIPKTEEAVMAETRILAYLQKNFPQESEVSEDTGSTLRNLVDDIGRRFVFEDGQPVTLRDDFLRVPLLRGWTNPAAQVD